MPDDPKYMVSYTDASGLNARLLTEEQLLSFLRELTDPGNGAIRNPNWTIKRMVITKQ